MIPSARLQRLAITLDPRGDAGAWRFEREAGADPATVLVGRTPEEAARLAPLVFNLCGAAHGFAAASALGLASGADRAAMARETVRDHALAILHHWPSALGAAPDRETLRLLARPDGERDFAAGLVGDGSDLSSFSRAELEAWLSEAPTATARLLARLRRDVDPAEGRAALPELTAQDVAAALSDMLPPSAFAPPSPVTPPAAFTSPSAFTPSSPGLSGGSTARPGARAGSGTAPAEGWMPRTSRGMTDCETAAEAETRTGGGAALRETSALGRVRTTPLLAALLATEGPSLFVRLLARLVDCLAALRPAPVEAQHLPPGIGLASAARGLLGHGSRVEDGRVTAYRVLSPSAWNLAPGGLLERAFAALSPGRDARRLAPLLVSAINPCVPVTLSFAPEPAYA